MKRPIIEDTAIISSARMEEIWLAYQRKFGIEELDKDKLNVMQEIFKNNTAEEITKVITLKLKKEQNQGFPSELVGVGVNGTTHFSYSDKEKAIELIKQGKKAMEAAPIMGYDINAGTGFFQFYCKMRNLVDASEIVKEENKEDTPKTGIVKEKTSKEILDEISNSTELFNPATKFRDLVHVVAQQEKENAQKTMVAETKSEETQVKESKLPQVKEQYKHRAVAKFAALVDVTNLQVATPTPKVEITKPQVESLTDEPKEQEAMEITPELKLQIKELVYQGLSKEEIAKRLNIDESDKNFKVAYSSFRGNYVRYVVKPPQTPVVKEEKPLTLSEKVRVCIMGGKSVEESAKELGVELTKSFKNTYSHIRGQITKEQNQLKRIEAALYNTKEVNEEQPKQEPIKTETVVKEPVKEEKKAVEEKKMENEKVVSNVSNAKETELKKAVLQKNQAALTLDICQLAQQIEVLIERKNRLQEQLDTINGCLDAFEFLEQNLDNCTK